jgi:hypothetical protein
MPENTPQPRRQPIRLLSLSAVCRRLRIAKARLIEAVRAGKVRPDYVTDCGAVLWRGPRLGAISRILNPKKK